MKDNENGAELDIAPHGAHVLAWRIPWNGRLFNIIDGYCSPEELEAQPGSRSRLLAPFSNRIAAGRYRFDRLDHQLAIDKPDENTAIHGLVSKTAWRRTEAHCSDDSAILTLQTDILRRGRFAGYPFNIDVTASFALARPGLAVTITGTNVGDVPAPFGSGWHPYFRTPSEDISQLRLTLPATAAIRTDTRNIPLPGRDAYAPLDGAFQFNPPHGGKIGALRMDTAFAGLRHDAHGKIATRVDDDAAGVAITLTQTRGLLHIYTGDTLSRRARQALAIEPVEVMTNAFNRMDCADAIGLEPGCSRVFRIEVRVACEH